MSTPEFDPLNLRIHTLSVLQDMQQGGNLYMLDNTRTVHSCFQTKDRVWGYDTSGRGVGGGNCNLNKSVLTDDFCSRGT